MRGSFACFQSREIERNEGIRIREKKGIKAGSGRSKRQQRWAITEISIERKREPEEDKFNVPRNRGMTRRADIAWEERGKEGYSHVILLKRTK